MILFQLTHLFDKRGEYSLYLVLWEALEELEKLRKECEILLERTKVYREDILNVKTEEDAKQFDETHDIEEGLEIIRL